MWLRNNSFSVVLALGLSLGSATVVEADSLNGSGSLQSDWNSSILAVDGSSSTIGTPYWNNDSGDGPKANIGWCMTGGGGCTMPVGAPGALPYFGNGPGSAGLMYFTSTGSPVSLSLQTIMTTQTSVLDGYDVLGYYIANAGGGAASSATLHPLFDTRTSSVGDASTLSGLTAGENYGFYIENIKGEGTPFATDYLYFMDSSANTANGSMPADPLQHFVAFSGGNGNYFLGDVDGDACTGSFMPTNSPCVPNSQFDYNNMVVAITPGAATTPEPSSIALLGGGVFMLSAVFLRRKTHMGRNTEAARD